MKFKDRSLLVLMTAGLLLMIPQLFREEWPSTPHFTLPLHAA